MPEKPQETRRETAKAPEADPVVDALNDRDPEVVQEQPAPDKVAVELFPDFELPDGADSATVSVGTFDDVELKKGESVKVDTEHARALLVSVPAVRRAE